MAHSGLQTLPALCHAQNATAEATATPPCFAPEASVCLLQGRSLPPARPALGAPPAAVAAPADDAPETPLPDGGDATDSGDNADGYPAVAWSATRPPRPAAAADTAQQGFLGIVGEVATALFGVIAPALRAGNAPAAPSAAAAAAPEVDGSSAAPAAPAPSGTSLGAAAAAHEQPSLFRLRHSGPAAGGGPRLHKPALNLGGAAGVPHPVGVPGGMAAGAPSAGRKVSPACSTARAAWGLVLMSWQVSLLHRVYTLLSLSATSVFMTTRATAYITNSGCTAGLVHSCCCTIYMPACWVDATASCCLWECSHPVCLLSILHPNPTIERPAAQYGRQGPRPAGWRVGPARGCAWSAAGSEHPGSAACC